MAAPHGTRRLLGHAEEEARADPCLGQRGTRPGLPYRRTRRRMKAAINEASARQRSGEPSPVRDQNGNRNAPPHRADIAEVGLQIASLADRSTQDLRVTWRRLHHTGPPPGLSRDLLIRCLAHQLQERTYGGVSLALRRRLRTVAAEFEKGASCS